MALETTPTLDIDFTKQFEAIMERLDQRSDNPGFLRGISTGFRGIDYVTGGLQAEQFVVLIGLPKAFKSATLLYMAKYIHGQAKVPLFIGFEMSNEEQTDRLTSLYGKVSLTDVMNGTFDVNQRDDIRRELKLVSQSRAFITSVDLASATTVVWCPGEDHGVPARRRVHRRGLPDADRATEGGAWLSRSPHRHRPLAEEAGAVTVDTDRRHHPGDDDPLQGRV